MDIGEHIQIVVSGQANIVSLLWKLTKEARGEISYDCQGILGKLSMVTTQAWFLKWPARLNGAEVLFARIRPESSAFGSTRGERPGVHVLGQLQPPSFPAAHTIAGLGGSTRSTPPMRTDPGSRRVARGCPGGVAAGRGPPSTA